MKISEHFHLEELVPKAIFQTYGAAAAQFIDPRLIVLLEFERSYFGKAITINNWADGGELQERGFRHPVTGTGAVFSQHKFGRAVDRNISGITPQEHYAVILASTKLWLDKGLTTIENIAFTKTWTHADVRDTSGFLTTAGSSFQWHDGLLIVNP